MSRMSLYAQPRGVPIMTSFSLNLIFQRQRHMSRVRLAKYTPRGSELISSPQISLFPSKMTAFGLKTAGEEVWNAGQPTGGSLPCSHSHPRSKCLFFSGRIGVPSDIAGLALFLSSPASAHITGSHILLDGGSRFTRHGIAPSLKL